MCQGQATMGDGGAGLPTRDADDPGPASTREARPRGRVPQAQRPAHDAALIAAAGALFLEHGFEGTSIEKLARSARVSPKTIYARYGGKAGLFGAVMTHLSEHALAPFRDIAVSGLPAGAALPEFGRRFLALVLSDVAIAMQRAVTAEAARFPEFARIYYDGGPRRGLDLLTAYLRGCAERGSLTIPDPARSAEAFIALAGGELVRRVLLNVGAAPSARDIASHADEAARIFLAAHRPAGQGSGET